jgi:xylulokinase
VEIGMGNLICVFDVGTTGARTIIFDINGREVSRAYEEYPIVKQPIGISEQDPELWWNCIKKTCNMAVRNIDIHDIIGVCGGILRQNSTIIGKNGEVLYPSITAMDERGVDFQQEEGLRLAIPKILWIKDEKPELFSKAHKIIFPDTYIYMKLCGNDLLITEPTNAIYGIMNIETLDWDSDLANKLDLPLDLWPDIRTPGEILGELSSEVAGVLGLKSNLPVVLGGGDQQCSALGMGIINQNQVKVTMGTYTFVDLVSGDKPLQPPGRDIPIFALPHVIKGKWILEGAMPGTGTALKWFKDNFSRLVKKECEEKNLSVYDTLCKEAEGISPGCEGLLFIPLQMFRKGTIHGLAWNHSRGHLIRSILESAALSAQMYLGLIEAIAKVKTTEVKADGGGMNNNFWAQILADVMDKKIIIPEVKDSSALGAAILGFYGCKIYSSIDNAIESMVRFEKEFNPNKANLKVYKKLNRLFMSTALDVYQKKRITKGI